MDETAEKVMIEVAKDVAKEAYSDVGKPIAKPTGELIGLIPRAIKAAFAPLEKWVLQKEYNVAETEKLLEQKLQHVSPELIEAPEAHVAVPALQYISYCMDNEELRDMYANLLANSMNKVVKNGVHPGFVEIIKQLSPDEAKLLKYMRINPRIPIISLRFTDEKGSGKDIIKDFSTAAENAGCEQPAQIKLYIDNLIRLGLLEKAPSLAKLSDKSIYDPLKNHPIIQEQVHSPLIKVLGFKKSDFVESYADLTEYGRQFCEICLNTPITVVVNND